MNDLIKELKEYFGRNIPAKERPILDEILFRHEKDTEPLAVLADRKGFDFVASKFEGLWTVSILPDGLHNDKSIWDCFSPTYASAESKAREYLNGLPDKEAK